jgi:hypothetical protein
MSDTIIGISVLQPIWIPGIYHLWFQARKADGTEAQGSIFIRDAAAVGLPDKMPDWPETSNTIWKFTRNGHRLDCFPSVNWISFEFHNGYNWFTDYVEMIFAEPKDDSDVKREQRGHTIHYDLRIIGIDQQKEIADLRAQGVLR